MIRKFIQFISAILLFIVVVYGIVYAQQASCRTIAEACIPAFSRDSGSDCIDGCCNVSPTNNRNNPLLSANYSGIPLSDVGSDNACCEPNRCDGYNQGTACSISFIQGFYPFQLTISSFDANISEQPTFHPKKRSGILNTVPIYILTESIIC